VPSRAVRVARSSAFTRRRVGIGTRRISGIGLPACVKALLEACRAFAAALSTLSALLFAGAAWAACPGDAGEPLPPAEALQASEQRLARLASECGRHAGYLAYHGAVLNALGRPAEAALLLEQALLLDPRRAAAQIDYAEALAALGDHASAAALLRDALARPDVPASLRPRLESRLDASAAAADAAPHAALSGPGEHAAAAWHGAGTLSLKWGRDSNLNSAPSRDALTLTLPGGDAVLALADRFRPRAGAAVMTEASGQAVRLLGGGAALQFYGEARLRDNPGSDADYQQVQAGGAWRQPLESGSALFGAGASDLRYGGTDLYRAVRLAASRDWNAAVCRPSLGVEVEHRRYPAVPELQGRYAGLNAGLACAFDVERLVLAGRNGRDLAQASRPGDNQRHTELRVNWARPAAGGRLSADLLWHRQQDAGGYSPLLANGAARRLERISVVLEYAYPVAPGWSLVASAENLAQRSNLELFGVSGRALYVGVRWTSAR